MPGRLPAPRRAHTARAQGGPVFVGKGPIYGNQNEGPGHRQRRSCDAGNAGNQA